MMVMNIGNRPTFADGDATTVVSLSSHSFRREEVEYHVCDVNFEDCLILFCYVDLQEVHILHEYETDFYGKDAAIVVLGFIRPEMKFSSLGWYLSCCAYVVSCASADCLLLETSS
jgi:FAD synthase